MVLCPSQSPELLFEESHTSTVESLEPFCTLPEIHLKLLSSFENIHVIVRNQANFCNSLLSSVPSAESCLELGFPART